MDAPKIRCALRRRATRVLNSLAVAASLAAAPSSAEASDFVVGPGQVQSALNTARPGDRIFLEPGVYTSSTMGRADLAAAVVALSVLALAATGNET